MQKRDEDSKQTRNQSNYIQTQHNSSPIPNVINPLDPQNGGHQNGLAQQLQTLSASRRYSRTEIKVVQSLIESCLRNYLSESDTINELYLKHSLDPAIVSQVWNKLVDQNVEFFRAYVVRLKVKNQMIEFNNLINEQASKMHKQRDLMRQHLQQQQQHIHLQGQQQSNLQFSDMYDLFSLDDDYPNSDILGTGLPIQQQPYVKQETSQPPVKNVKISQQTPITTTQQPQQVSNYNGYYVPPNQSYQSGQFVQNQNQPIVTQNTPQVQQITQPVIPPTEVEHPSTGLYDLSSNVLGIEDDFDQQFFLPYTV
jgi:uncharacterized protein (TIGR01589 family)